MRRHFTGTLLILFAVLSTVESADAARISDISNTKHNFSATVAPSETTRDAVAVSESQICAFCHTPHGATNEARTPLWNRTLSNATYTPYSSTSLDAIDLGQPEGKSKLCLSCHDGTLALGSVNVLNREELKKEGRSLPFQGTRPDGTIPDGLGETTGFTRRIGVDLSNDHPISFTFDSAQATRDGELFNPAAESHIKERRPGSGPPFPQAQHTGVEGYLPLEDGQVECITCHDPHIRSDDPNEGNIKFLRVNRMQRNAEPVDKQFNADNDIICIACHDKAGWVGSAHANRLAADERYEVSAGDLREFPRDTQVWQAACLNCHDPHTVQGSRRILREGTDGPTTIDPVTGAKFKQGGEHAIEEVCFACHSQDGGVLAGQGGIGFQVPDVKTDFVTPGNTHMPLQSADQRAGREVHSIGTGSDGPEGLTRGQDFVESPEKLGKGNLMNRHVECTDCHNPHRVAKNRMFNANNAIPDDAGTHPHTPADIAANGLTMHSNLASGVLRGITGVEPVYGSAAFGSEPISFTLKRGDPGTGGRTDVDAPYVTREYQVCLKCHSNYSYDTPPPLGLHGGSTPVGTNEMFEYTNQAMEYQAPPSHMGETSSFPTPGWGPFVGVDAFGNDVNFESENHRSWHPVMDRTGRTAGVGSFSGGERRAASDVWRTPFNINGAVGNQTMYCTDCHGNNTANDTVIPNGGVNGEVWGPHGSQNNFLLKGPWDDQTGRAQPDGLCFRCHDYNQYGRDILGAINNGDLIGPNAIASGFKAVGGSSGCLNFRTVNLHLGHNNSLGLGVNNFRCTLCHIAVPHGWKNKVFLANLNDVGEEAGLAPGTQVRYLGFSGNTNKPNGTGRYYAGPYYNGAALKVDTFSRSGLWTDANCGSSGTPGNGIKGFGWMTSLDETCANLP